MPNPQRPLRSPREGEDAFAADLRRQFFGAVEEVAPHVGRELEDGALSTFVGLVEHLEQSGAHKSWRDLAGLRSAADRRDRAEGANSSAARVRVLDLTHLQADLLRALEAWATPYNLHRDDWCFEHALLHLRLLQHARARGHNKAIPLGLVGPAVSPQPYVEVSGPAYVPMYETRGEYLRRVDTYMEEREKVWRAAGYNEPPHKPHDWTHLRWLARHHVLGLSYEEAGRATKAKVRKAILAMYSLLGLTPRPAPGRRTPK